MGKDTAIVPLPAGLPVGLPDLSSDLSLGLGADSAAHEFVLMHQMHKVTLVTLERSLVLDGILP